MLCRLLLFLPIVVSIVVDVVTDAKRSADDKNYFFPSANFLFV